MPQRARLNPVTGGTIVVWDQPGVGFSEWIATPPGVVGITLELAASSSGAIEMTSQIEALNPAWSGAGYNWSSGVITTTTTPSKTGGAVQGASAVRLNITAGSGSAHFRMP